VRFSSGTGTTDASLDESRLSARQRQVWEGIKRLLGPAGVEKFKSGPATPDQLATELARREPSLKSAGQTPMGWVVEVREVLERLGLSSKGGMSTIDERGNRGDPRNREAVKALLPANGNAAGLSLQEPRRLGRGWGSWHTAEQALAELQALAAEPPVDAALSLAGGSSHRRAVEALTSFGGAPRDPVPGMEEALRLFRDKPRGQ
jgi:hypothetical protein